MNYLVVVVLALALVGCGPKQQTVQPVVQRITQAVYASGRLYPKNYYRVAARMPGVVAEVYVVAGDTVRQGMPLIKIKNTTAEIGVEVAQNAYALAEDNARETSAYLSAAQAEYESARAKYEYDSVSAYRQQRLLDAQATSRSVYDAAATQLDVSRQQLRKAQQTYRTIQQRAQLERRNALLQVQAQRSNRDEYIIYAVEDGVVYDVVPNVGEVVSPPMLLIELGRASDYEVELSIDETDIALLSLGQRVVYTIDSYKNERFEGVITHINPRVSASDKTAKVTASISRPSRVTFLPGMSLEANIVVAERRNAVVIPRDYLKPGSMVQVQRSSGMEMIKVTTGIEDLRYVEVVKGLSPSDVLVR